MNKTLLLTGSILAILAVGCATQPEAQNTATTAGDQAPSEAVASVLDAYESIRTSLASDQEPEPSHYADLAAAVRQATDDYQATARDYLVELATAASAAADRPAAGLPGARMQFGKVSEPLIGFLSTQPELAQGRFVFECPMEKEYPKWVQGSETASNPYLGKAMPSCGTRTGWTP